MSDKLKYRRVLLKLSGKSFGHRTSNTGIDPSSVIRNAALVRDVYRLGVEVCIVVGGSNLWRGSDITAVSPSERFQSDFIGTIGTAMNALALQLMLKRLGIPVSIESGIRIESVDVLNLRRMDVSLGKREAVIAVGGMDNELCTSDTTAAQRAVEIGADLLIKATDVPGIFTKDPKAHNDAVRYIHISYDDAIRQKPGVMDANAFLKCRKATIPIVVFHTCDAQAPFAILRGDSRYGTYVGDVSTKLAS